MIPTSENYSGQRTKSENSRFSCKENVRTQILKFHHTIHKIKDKNTIQLKYNTYENRYNDL